jgi:single-strand DNA-binding protein
MGSMNKAIIIGNLGRDAELRYTPGGTAICKFSVAATETWNDKSGQRQERTTWLNVDLWGKSAESLTEYLTKGKQVCVEGKIQIDEYTDKDQIKRKSFTIRADRVVLLGGGGGRGDGQQRGRARAPENDNTGYGGDIEPEPTGPLTDDDIPF